jgi:hypothetical protein
MTRYRICYTDDPFKGEFWIIERETLPGWWKPAEHEMIGLTGSSRPWRYKSEADAQARVNLLKKGRVHRCGAPQ